MGNEESVLSELPGPAGVEFSIEDLVTVYAITMDDKQVVNAKQAMGLHGISLEDLTRICVAQSWVIKDLLNGPLAGVKFYKDHEGMN